MIIFCRGVTPPQRVVINGANMCRGLVNQVDPDHSEELLNGTWKRAGELCESHKKKNIHSTQYMGYFLTFTGWDCSRNKEDVCNWAWRPGGNKHVISDVLTRKIEGTSWMVVDGQARVVALGKPSGSGTFWRLGWHFFCRMCTLKWTSFLYEWHHIW